MFDVLGPYPAHCLFKLFGPYLEYCVILHKSGPYPEHDFCCLICVCFCFVPSEGALTVVTVTVEEREEREERAGVIEVRFFGIKKTTYETHLN